MSQDFSSDYWRESGTAGLGESVSPRGSGTFCEVESEHRHRQAGPRGRKHRGVIVDRAEVLPSIEEQTLRRGAVRAGTRGG